MSRTTNKFSPEVRERLFAWFRITGTVIRPIGLREDRLRISHVAWPDQES